MTKTDFVRKHAERRGVGNAQAKTEVDLILELISESLVNGEDIQINEFGKFSVRDRKARSGINPRTMERVDIPATKVVHFSPAQKLKDLVAA